MQTKEARSLAWMLLCVFCWSLFSPTVTFAGGGGPTQPEVHGFTPIGMSDMVDPFTGDFNYNIPLMDIEGYPVNLAYSSGITMDQEASWVGLGWNLNMGAIVRSMRGVPDDFDGDKIEKITYKKPQKDLSVGINIGGIELFGFDKDEIKDSGALNLNVGMTVSHNNYTGLGVDFDLGPSFKFVKNNETAFGGGLTFSGSSENGAGVSANVSYSKLSKYENEQNKKNGYSIGLGGGFNSRAGLTHLSYNASIEKAKQRDAAKSLTLSDPLKEGIKGAYNIGLASYSPFPQPSMLSTSVSGNFKTTLTFLNLDGQASVNFAYNEQYIDPLYNLFYTPAYGYFNLQNGQTNPSAQLDFNRDNEGSITKYTPNLPSTFLTADIFSVNAQGTGGSFKGSRNELGYTFDPISISTSENSSFGIEAGVGNAFELSVDLSYNNTVAYNGVWDNNENNARDIIRFENAAGINETYAIREANEKSVDTDPFMTTHFSPSTLQALDLKGVGLMPRLEDEIDGSQILTNNRSSRQKRNNVLSFLTIADVQSGLGLNLPHPNMYSGNKPHHIGEMTQLGTDGRRYVFGIPAYNHIQRDATFSIGSTLDGTAGFTPSNYYDGLVELGSNFNTLASGNNNKGIDNGYSEEVTPAYAHSFLLSAVLSDDYVDSDNQKGPSLDDQGSYVKFSYTKLDNVEWRSPVEENSAFYNPGLKTDETDDKASVTYGKKDVWYVSIVETKNYVAVFELENRKDAKNSTGFSGGIDTLVPAGKCLKSITLYARPEYEAHVNNLSQATPIQKVHFEYDYSLCPGYPGNLYGGGKLTLKKVYFSYQGSYKLKRSAYVFNYDSQYNYPYNMKAVDRWGNYKPVASGDATAINSPLTSADDPYTNQNRNLTDGYVQAWTLSSIKLPSGGTMFIEYESDDYAFVQYKQAAQMMPICAVSDKNENMKTDALNGQFVIDSVAGQNSVTGKEVRSIYVKMKPGFNKVSDYLDIDEPLYYRALVEMFPGSNDPNRFEYVGAYAKVKSADTISFNSEKYLKIDFEPEKLIDNGTPKYSPISKAGILFGRMHLPRTFNGLPNVSPGATDQSGITEFANDVVEAFASFGELFVHPNKTLYEQGKCQRIILNKSFVRLKEPTGHKLGGGLRVKTIKIYDNWNEMTEEQHANFIYGQEYNYNLPDGRSSGVASYEPQFGGDENSMHKPYFFDQKLRMAPDDKLFLDEPVMESQFPTPSVGYSRVTIKNIAHSGVSRNATGKIVKEFYTAKDFPTFVHYTDMENKSAKSFLPILPKYQYLTANQGFLIETNDMHGKPKAEYVYPEDSDNEISEVKYEYGMTSITYDGVQCFKLVNDVLTIRNDGTNATAQIGVRTETVADFQKNETNSIGGAIQLNGNASFSPIFTWVPTIWGNIDINHTQLRLSTLNKTVERFGILKTTRAKRDGSEVETNNLAYDAETGEVLLTQTTTNFNDKVYSLNYPAHWEYEQMGMAYKNIGYKLTGFNVAQDGFVPVPANLNHFVEGDEVKVTSSSFSGVKKGWVLQVSASGIRLIDAQGNPISGANSTITIIRSGRRNKQTTSIASVTTLSNPINALQNGTFTNVLNAGAVEFSNDWRTYCNCYFSERPNYSTTNPYISNNKGVWRPIKSYTYLTDRVQSNTNGNTNIRKDGVFAGYSPYYQYVNNNWQSFKAGWTFVSEVTEFSPSGTTLETRDALGRYSTSLQGFNGTLTTAVAANAKLTQVVEGSFEDMQFSNCSDQSFFKDVPVSYLSTAHAHTGRNSIHLSSNQTLDINVVTPVCIDSSTCDISLTAVSDRAYTINNCNGSCTVSYEVISGTGSASISNGTLMLSNTSGNAYFEMLVYITNKTCTSTVKVRSIPPSNATLSVEIIE